MSTTYVKVGKAMVSSTSLDLPEHRKQVQDACQRQTFHPLMMEHLPASAAEAIFASMELVDQADIYIGVYAYRYGYVPAGHSVSVTEMEYDRAVERKIPRLIFIMGKKHPVTIDDVEMGEAVEKLKAFKERVGKENIVNFFSSPEELRSLVINSISKLPKEEGSEYRFHYVSDIPAPPQPYIAHPYVLSQAKGLVGRQAELGLLTDWFTGKKGLGGVRIFNVVAIGGMGKSALTWKWFNEIAPQEQPYPLMAGRMWWSFYESDAYFENFIIRALAYVGRMSIEEAKAVPPGQREDQLLAILDREPHLLVLDGLERILIAYARMDAALLADDDAYDKATANYLARAHGLSEAEKETFKDKHRLRKTADPRAGNFLRKLSLVRTSWILVSTRLYPFDLQRLDGNFMPGCSAISLKGLSDNDALELWRNFGVSGARDTLLPMFRSFGSHPLLLQALAGEVARYRPAPGDFDAWRKAKPDFNPFQLELKQAKTHVLQFALQGLSKAEWKALHTIAAFRMPAQYDTLRSLLCGEDKPCANEDALDKMLDELEDRGLIGWDRRANRYDLHPVVRGVVWSGVSEGDKQSTFSALQVHFGAAPKIDDYRKVNSFEDLTPAIELYHALIGLGKLDEACAVFIHQINRATLYRLGTSRQRIELLEKLFPDGLEQLPRLLNYNIRGFICNSLSLSYSDSGEPNKSVHYLKMGIEILEKEHDQKNLIIGLHNLSIALRLSGDLKAAVSTSKQVLAMSQEQEESFKEAVAWYSVGRILTIQGQIETPKAALEQSLEIFVRQKHLPGEGYANAALAQYYLLLCQPSEAQTYANRAWEVAYKVNLEQDLIGATCCQGQAALALGDYTIAHERLHQALIRSRAINFVQEELPALIALAELARQQGRQTEARDHLNDIWEYAFRGPYPLFHADACNVLCQIERDEGNTAAAIEAATKAYRLAWCDGPPWAYHYGLENAKKHLRELGAPEPEMPLDREEID
ncbi:MAG: DUF4062 domain-containing protein, partial [Saprospiraceae bacterium]